MHSCLGRRSRGVVGLSTSIALVAVACGGPGEHGFFDPAPVAGAGGTTGVGGATTGGSGGATGGSAGGAVGGTSGSGGSITAGTAGSVTGTGGTSGSGGDAGSTGGVGSGGVGAGGTGSAGSGGVTTGEAGMGGMARPIDCSAYGENAEDFDGHCYLFRDEERTWEEAVDDCEGRGAHLVTISSEGRTRADFDAENQFVWQLGGMVPVWIGATDGKPPNAPGDGTFYKWITGEPMTFDAWSSGQPNNGQGSCTEGTSCSCEDGACYEHCGFQWANAGVDPNTVPGWNDRLCEHKIAHVCEWEDP
jgi:hypothetical protein